MHNGVVAQQILKQQAYENDPAVAGSGIFGADEECELDIAGSRNLEPDQISAALDLMRAPLLPNAEYLDLIYKAYKAAILSEPLTVSVLEAFELLETAESLGATVTFDQLSDDPSDIVQERDEINVRLEEAKSDLPPAALNRLKERFAFLFEPDEGDPVRISPGSVRQLLQFLRKDRKLRCPSIVITNRQNVKAIWRASEMEIFWIEFEPNGDVTYLAFSPDEKRSDGVERLSGLSTVDAVMDRAKSSGALKWMRS